MKNLNSIPLPLLITGLPGVPGYSAFFYFQSRFPSSVWGAIPSHQKPLPAPGILTLDAETPKKIKVLFEKIQFKAVFDASGCCALRSCEHNPDMAERVNVKFGRALAEVCSRRRR